MKFGKYNYINTQDKILALDEFLMNSDDTPKYNIISVDTETNGLSHVKNVVVGFSLSIDTVSGFYIPILKWKPDKNSLKKRKISKVEVESYLEGCFVNVWTGEEHPEEVTPSEVNIPEWLSGAVERWFSHKDVKLIMHNAPFDCNMIHSSFGVDLTNNLYCDTVLLKHFLDENTRHGLKFIAELWKKELGFDPHKEAAMEQKELGASIIRNGGIFNARTKHVWRASEEYMCNYAIADTFLTLGVYIEGMRRLEANFEPKHIELFYNEEIMPVCKEVVIPMQRQGVHIDVSHFEKLQKETSKKLEDLENEIHHLLGDRLEGFSVGKSRDEVIGKKALLKRIMELEGLVAPTKFDKKTGLYKETLAKAEVRKVNDKSPHWFWGYLLGEDELKYSEAKLDRIKAEMFYEKSGRRYHFNIASIFHLRWLFIKKLKHDPLELPQTDSATKENPLPQMSADILKTHFSKYDFVKPLLLWKKLSKLQSTYINPALELEIDGILYMNWMQAGTTTGRFSCSGGYNLQTLPRVEEYDRCYACESKNVEIVHSIDLLAKQTCKDCGKITDDILCSSAIKKGFVTPKGYKIVNADFASQEVRCFAYMSGDSEIKKIFTDNLDFYSKVYIDTMDERGQYSADPKDSNYLKKVNKSARDMIKPVALGIPFGALGPQVTNLLKFKTKRMNNKTKVMEEVPDFERGKKYKDAYLKAYPELHNYMTKMEMEAISKGWVENIVGRRRKFVVAPTVYKLFLKKGIDYLFFIEVGKKKLSGTDAKIHDVALTSDDLRTLFKDLGHSPESISKLKEKGNFNWAYIKSKFKNEIDIAKNYPIQSLAAHITNRSMLDVTRLFKGGELEGARVFSVIHDEIACYVKDCNLKMGSDMLQFGMEQNDFSKLLDIPMEAEPIIAETLKEAK